MNDESLKWLLIDEIEADQDEIDEELEDDGKDFEGIEDIEGLGDYDDSDDFVYDDEYDEDDIEDLDDE